MAAADHCTRDVHLCVFVTNIYDVRKLVMSRHSRTYLFNILIVIPKVQSHKTLQNTLKYSL